MFDMSGTYGIILFFLKQKTAYEMRISDWSSDVCSSDLNEACYGSLALVYSSGAAAGTVAPLVHPDALGELANTYPLHRAYIDAVADHVRDELHFIRTSRTRNYPRSLLYVEHGWDELLAHHEAAFRSWIEPVFGLGTSDAFHLFGFSEQFPLIGALEAYERLEPGSRARLLETALDPATLGSVRFGDLSRPAAAMKGNR